MRLVQAFKTVYLFEIYYFRCWDLLISVPTIIGGGSILWMEQSVPSEIAMLISCFDDGQGNLISKMAGKTLLKITTSLIWN